MFFFFSLPFCLYSLEILDVYFWLNAKCNYTEVLANFNDGDVDLTLPFMA